MKNILLSAFILLPGMMLAQGITLVRMENAYPNTQPNPAAVCYPTEVLRNISDQMYQQGNPNYVWVDLLKDGYITNDEGHSLNLYIYNSATTDKGNIPVPDEAGKRYAEKWAEFVASLHVKLSMSAPYHLSAWNGIAGNDVINEKSEFRQTTKGELYFLSLNPQGELRFCRELIKEGLTSPNDSLSWNFTINGYFVNGKRLNAEQREKFRTICMEEFGTDYNKLWQTTNSSFGYPLSEHMQKLEARLIN